MAGEGETQLALEKRLITEKESKIRKELIAENERRAQLRMNRKKEHSVIPRIAIVTMILFYFFSLSQKT